VQYIFNYASKEYVGRRMLVDIVTVEGLPSIKIPKYQYVAFGFAALGEMW
jgi:hypothetical protein